MFWTSVLCLTVVLLWWYRRRKKGFRFFIDQGIAGPTPNFIIGNLIEVQDGLSAAVSKWGKQYGKTFGFFEGPVPILVTSDVDILRQIFIKDYHKFAARKRFPIQSHPDDEDRVHLFFSDGARWKRQRGVMTKAFSASRLKMMTPTIHNSVQSMLSIIAKKADLEQAFDIYPIFQCLTLEIIMSVGFGVDFDAQRDKENIFLKKCRSVFTDNMPTSGKRPLFAILVALAIIFPSLNSVWHRLHVWLHEKNIDPDSTFWFMDAAGEIIKRRRLEKKSRIDFIQLMLDVELDSDSESAGSETDDDEALTMTLDPEDRRRRPRPGCPLMGESGKKYFTFEEMKANCQLFLLAGYETTSTALAYIAYELALHQDMQQRIYEEVVANIPKEEMGTYQTVKGLKHLDMFVFETFRVHPIAPFVIGRTCLEEVTYKGIHIRRNQAVLANVFALQFDPACWVEPERFWPERFRRESRLDRDSMYYLPFGAGPRNCLGMRFALHEIRVSVSELLRRYAILPCDRTEIPLQTAEMATIVPKHGLPVLLKSRDVAAFSCG